MLWLNNGVFIVLAAIFTFLYFGLWLKDNTRAFLNWIQRAKGDFAIFGEYADRFADMFLKNKEGKSTYWRKCKRGYQYTKKCVKSKSLFHS